MKTYKQIISEVAEPIGGDEKRFKAKHVIKKIDHPVADENQFTAKNTKKDKSKISGYKAGEDETVYEGMDEATLTDLENKRKEHIVSGMKKSEADLKARYGDKWKSLMYATATKNALHYEDNHSGGDKKVALAHPTYDAYVTHNKAKGFQVIPKNLWDDLKKNPNTPSVKKESVKLDEISKQKLYKYSVDNEKDREDLSMNKIGWIKGTPTADQQKNIDKLNKRVKGDQLAGRKTYPTVYKNTPYAAKVPATESIKLDEAFKAGAMKLNDGSSVSLTNESSNALNSLFNQLTSTNRTKMEQKLMSGSKGFNEILAFAKEV